MAKWECRTPTFQGVGWLNPAEVAEQDAKTFLATCTDSPE
jgi:hypothetical protein